MCLVLGMDMVRLRRKRMGLFCLYGDDYGAGKQSKVSWGVLAVLRCDVGIDNGIGVRKVATGV